MNDIDNKICRVCKNEKHFSEFVWMPSMPDNRDDTCRQCVSNEEFHHRINSKQVAALLSKETNLPVADIYLHPALIEAKKYCLLIKRNV